MRSRASSAMPFSLVRILAAYSNVVVALVVALTVAGCGERSRSKDAPPKEAAKAVAVPSAPAKRYVYGDWSDWQLDCSKRVADASLPCAAVRKRICEVEDTQEGVACDQCGGQCKEEVADTKPPLYIYAAWSEWNDRCDRCSAEPKPCQAERSRTCLERVAGKSTDCEFCGGACKEQQHSMSSCAPECKWTVVHAYSDAACTAEIQDDTFAGQWGPQTNSPFNAGCSETQWSDKCVQFGRAYYKWEPCVPGCSPPFKK
jgi:hypothetical protein